MCTTCGCGSGSTDHHHGHHHEHRHDHDRDHDGHAERPRHEHARDEVHRKGDARTARTLRLERELLAKNAELAAANRRAVAHGRMTLLNLIGSPGAGKTALLEALIPRLRKDAAIGVLEGDQATDRDAQRIRDVGCPVVQINTGAGCHLDATMVEQGLTLLSPPPGSIVFVENVGNLVCPALFDIGEHAKVVVMSVTEGEDKPLKYPHVFRAAKLFVLTKIDLSVHVDFDERRCVENARDVAGRGLSILRVSARSGEGLDVVEQWIRREAERAEASP
jgi:hydrogenase nickel incorporation protein HypB